jgi:hypothetical protein
MAETAIRRWNATPERGVEVETPTSKGVRPVKHALVPFVIAALVMPAAALGKGPSAASLSGPGADGGISFGRDGEDGVTALSNLVNHSGLFRAVFGEEPDPILQRRPKGDLGPEYTITWTVPGPSNELWKLRQEVYPYASPAPVTYIEPGQQVYDQQTRGGWFQADAALKRTLVEAGLPSTWSGASSGSSAFPTALVTVSTAALLVAMATALLIRRRARPAAA